MLLLLEQSVWEGEDTLMRTVVLIFVLLVAILLVIFGAQNTQLVSVHFLMIDTGSVSLSLVIVISAVIGAVLASLITVWGSIRRGFRGRRADQQKADLEARSVDLETRVAALERENAELRAATRTTAASPELRAPERGGSPPEVE
jgi:uncharacterized integral membrane protein